MAARMRPWRMPADRETSRQAAAALCSVAPDREAAREALMAAGLIRDPDIRDAHIGMARANLTAQSGWAS
jgi:hypothetical protein